MHCTRNIFVKLFFAFMEDNDYIFGLQLNNAELYRAINDCINHASTFCLPIVWNFTTFTEQGNTFVKLYLASNELCFQKEGICYLIVIVTKLQLQHQIKNSIYLNKLLFYSIRIFVNRFYLIFSSTNNLIVKNQNYLYLLCKKYLLQTCLIRRPLSSYLL